MPELMTSWRREPITLSQNPDMYQRQPSNTTSFSVVSSQKLDETITVYIEVAEDGMLIAEVPNIQGCYAQGTDLQEVLENIKEVITLCLSDPTGEAQPISDQKLRVEVRT